MNYQQRGLTLVEVMVALGLAAVLASGLYRVVITNQQAMALTNSFINMQESTRTAFNLLEHDIRMIGFVGCSVESEGVSSYLNTSVSGFNEFLFDYTLPAVEVVDGEKLRQKSIASRVFKDVDGRAINVDDGAEILVMRRAVSSGLILGENITDQNDNLKLLGDEKYLNNLKVGTIAMISDCIEMKVFQITEVGAGDESVKYDTTRGTIGAYKRGAQIMPLITSVYFIGESNELSGVSSLYRYDTINNRAVEMIPYISKVKYRYYVHHKIVTETGAVVESYNFEESLGSTAKPSGVEVELYSNENPSCSGSSCPEPRKQSKLIQVRNASKVVE